MQEKAITELRELKSDCTAVLDAEAGLLPELKEVAKKARPQAGLGCSALESARTWRPVSCCSPTRFPVSKTCPTQLANADCGDWTEISI